MDEIHSLRQLALDALERETLRAFELLVTYGRQGPAPDLPVRVIGDEVRTPDGLRLYFSGTSFYLRRTCPLCGQVLTSSQGFMTLVELGRLLLAEQIYPTHECKKEEDV